jgi:hypothetical protein
MLGKTTFRIADEAEAFPGDFHDPLGIPEFLIRWRFTLRTIHFLAISRLGGFRAGPALAAISPVTPISTLTTTAAVEAIPPSTAIVTLTAFTVLGARLRTCFGAMHLLGHALSAGGFGGFHGSARGLWYGIGWHSNRRSLALLFHLLRHVTRDIDGVFASTGRLRGGSFGRRP